MRGIGSSEKYKRMVAEETFILDATEEICRILDENEITQAELAKRIKYRRVSYLLSGKRNMTLRTLAHIAYALDHKIEIALIPLVEESTVREAADDSAQWGYKITVHIYYQSNEDIEQIVNDSKIDALKSIFSDAAFIGVDLAAVDDEPYDQVGT